MENRPLAPRADVGNVQVPAGHKVTVIPTVTQTEDLRGLQTTPDTPQTGILQASASQQG